MLRIGEAADQAREVRGFAGAANSSEVESSPSSPTPPRRGVDRSPRTAGELMDAVMWNREPIGGQFVLTDHRGQQRRDSDFRGKLMLVYFGFTQCPSICPTDLQQISLALEELGDDAAQVAPLFVTLDPQRDTVALLSQYAPAFSSRLIGLTGDAAAIRRLADSYRVYYAKVPVPGRSHYTIDHSSFIYLRGRDGRYLGFLPPGTEARKIAQTVRPHLRQ